MTNFRRDTRGTEVDMKRGRNKRTRMTERDARVVELVTRFRLLSRDQLMAMAPFGSLTRANTRLGALARAKILSRKLLPIYPGHGSAQALYYRGPANGEDSATEDKIRVRQTRQVSRWGLPQVEHVLAANQLLVDFLVAVRRSADASLLAYQTEVELRTAIAAQRLVPDGWIAWLHREKRFNCFIEVDLHHEGLQQWRHKVLAYLQYADSGQHAELFGFSFFRVLVVAKSAARLANLMGLAHQAGRLFLFTEINQARTETILSSIWRPASGGSLIRLVEA